MSVGTQSELETAFASKMALIKEGMEEGIKVDGANVEVKSEDATKLRDLYNEAQEIKTYIEMGRAAEKGLNFSNGVDVLPAGGGSAAMDDAAKKYLTSLKSVGELLTGSDQFKAMLEAKSYNMVSPLELEVFDLGSMNTQVKDVYTAMNPGSITRTFGNIQFDPMVPRGKRSARVRDLFPVAATTANLIDYYRVMGFVENQTNLLSSPNAAIQGGSGNAGPAAEYVAATTSPVVPGNFGLKRKSNLVFADAQAPVRTLAHWEAAHRNALDDEPQLQAVINNELLYGLALEEDYQLLYGTGSNGDLTGILQTSGIQTYSAPTNELGSDSLRKAATLSVIANYPSTGYVLNPLDWQQIEIQKGTTSSGGDGQYMLFTNISIGASASIWRLPVVETPAIAQGSFLSGAFGTAAQIYDRQQANVRIADQHADMFVRNAIAILVEERLALAIKRPEAFVLGTFSAVA